MSTNIGIIIATYNGEEFIGEQLNSILDQTQKPNLIVVSDGKSSDRTVEICNRILNKAGIPFRILTSDDQLNVQDNFNKALCDCNCDYVFFSDQDDFWDKRKIETTINYMNSTNSCLAFTNAALTDGTLKPRGVSLWDSIGFNPHEKVTVFKKDDPYFISELIKHNVVTGMTMCINSELRNFSLPLSSYAIHDKWVSLLAIHYGNVVAINEELVLYRQHEKNVVGTDRSLKKSLKNKKNYLKKLEDRQCMIAEVIHKLEVNGMEHASYVYEYLTYLQKRVDFVHGINTLFSLVCFTGQYFRYEYRPFEIIIKDIIIRNTNQD